jgi:hypothetical protein
MSDLKGRFSRPPKRIHLRSLPIPSAVTLSLTSIGTSTRRPRRMVQSRRPLHGAARYRSSPPASWTPHPRSPQAAESRFSSRAGSAVSASRTCDRFCISALTLRTASAKMESTNPLSVTGLLATSTALEYRTCITSVADIYMIQRKRLRRPVKTSSGLSGSAWAYTGPHVQNL